MLETGEKAGMRVTRLQSRGPSHFSLKSQLSGNTTSHPGVRRGLLTRIRGTGNRRWGIRLYGCAQEGSGCVQPALQGDSHLVLGKKTVLQRKV